MSLRTGDKLGPYEIQSLLGAGGMGEVYRARDTRLGRDVAIKVSQERFSERFDREARAVAALNHPNICALYDVGSNYLVMEFIDGESPKGPMPLDEALGIARQIADALAEAHEKGIVHRDLKPANIKIKHDGTVKVLDFGLAKQNRVREGTEYPEDSPTLSMAATEAGVILGTAAYMSPEQARGRRVDTRTDIWAFGVVLHELLTGERLFLGEDLTETLASVVKEQPDFTEVPHPVRKLLETCLQKDPKKRLQAIGDWRLLLAETAVGARPSSKLWSRIGWIAAGMATLAAMTLAFMHFREMPSNERQWRLSVPLPENSSAGFLEISPDGKRLVVMLVADGKQQLYLRSFDSDVLQPLTGTFNARCPFWSADSRSIAFFADGKLKVIPAAGGPTQVLCDETGTGQGGSWSRDGVILLAIDGGFLRRTDAKGGACRPLGNDANLRGAYPTFLPDGDHFFYVSQARLDGGSPGVYLATLKDPSGHKIVSDRSSVVYAPSVTRKGLAHVLFLRENALMAQPFDEASFQPVGDPFVLVPSASSTFNGLQVAASASVDGSLVYLAGRSREMQLTWFDRTGKDLGKVGPPAAQRAPNLSPDGTMVTMERLEPDGSSFTWLHDFPRNSESRVTPAEFGGSGNAVWLSDSKHIWLAGVGPKGAGLYEKDLRSGKIKFLEVAVSAERQRNRITMSDVSRDGRFLIFSENDPKTRSDIWDAPIESGKLNLNGAVKIEATAANESQAQLSPDGKLLAYYSDETGKGQVHIRPFPSGEQVWTVPGEAITREPRWRGDGKELFYISLGSRETISIMATSVTTDVRGGVLLGIPEKLFDARALAIIPQDNAWTYAVRADGKQFLVNALTQAGEPTMNVISNWNRTPFDNK